MIRYSIIHKKNPREILFLRGNGCRWRKCAFCDYHLDCSSNETENLLLNREIMAYVTGMYHHLEVINSGSFPELGTSTLLELVEHIMPLYVDNDRVNILLNHTDFVVGREA